ncbi:cation transporter [Quisquiliibacterium transsilvanicum]|uniref:Divalent metal cation (Fe/Co/Zn/Cd) transporter n=1 Tax=Quisquiliibacterium transsilvanicum TaxID=1549638 RepID=A0A7W8HLN6_9BURK|nr:divalent metal cation (Fe/Co/Zn/Cd) transporter [Quisquiliibacterium transsilvanicum]
MSHPGPLRRFAWLSILAALVTIALKSGAWWLTGSVGFLSDALESLVNVAGAVMALAMLAIASRPADELHAFGHGKAESFSCAFEGALIAPAAGVNILWTGWRLARHSAHGLMDGVLPSGQLEALDAVLEGCRAQGLDFHAGRNPAQHRVHPSRADRGLRLDGGPIPGSRRRSRRRRCASQPPGAATLSP